MLNRYPLWKYLFVLFVMMIGALYALPNLYGEDPAVQISGARGASADLATLDLVKQTLDKQAIPYQSVVLEKSTVLARFASTEQQIKARDAIADLKNADLVVALNLAPATPRWLAAIGASPMKLGLDLRGGVHFLMEVDMDAAMEKLLNQQEDRFR
ncbi:MAG: protein translocase subunit SecD, partial [Enterovibrio sp.]